MGVAGSSYGYSLMWVLVLAVLMRFLFVSLIAKYQLCNPHGEGVLDGLARLHGWYPAVLLAAVLIMAHVYQAYMAVGCGEALHNMTGVGAKWQWALLCNVVAFLLVFQPVYKLLEIVFLFFLGLLAVSFLGTALWVGFNPAGVVQGLFRLEMPGEVEGKFDPLLVAVAMIGAIAGSIMNLAYPYFLEEKGWRGPQYRRVQFYDFLLAMIVLIVLNLAIWTLGAELLYPGKEIKKMDDLPKLLSTTLGEGGRILFYLGIFAAIYTSVIGHAAGLAFMGAHAYLRWQAGAPRSLPPEPDSHPDAGPQVETAVTKEGPLEASLTAQRPSDTPEPIHPVLPVLAGPHYRQHPLYRWIVIWSLASPLVWTLPGMPDFVTLTLIGNSFQIVLLPLIYGGIWWITADRRFIGTRYRNRWWENLVMVFLFTLAIYMAFKALESIVLTVQKGI
jgi:Mn2+/Fe2+ NRAMP family transporter